MNIGILALQGSFLEHGLVLKKLNKNFSFVKDKKSLEKITHLIIPGGESTTIFKLLDQTGMWKILEQKIKKNTISIFGTCAGAIICEKLGANFSIQRNAYGGQLSSFISDLNSKIFKNLKGVFIRAPKILVKKNQVKILAYFEKEPVLVHDKKFLAASFHPELNNEARIYEYFLNNF